ncbi:hypothetical protein ACAX43_17835 [Paraburkholderia sp. IW21]|uniref:hypothetical protein n=1 Tax=Paraburkholderia sp. IW21 TaxID=3242488 RepID=UPI0035230028
MTVVASLFGLTGLIIDFQEQAMTKKKVPTSSTGEKSITLAATKKTSRAILGKDTAPNELSDALSTTVTTVTTADLKSQFAAGSIPLSTDFSNLIDIAECGRRAVGQSADQTDNTVGAGLALAADTDTANKGKLSVKAANGIGSDGTGVYVKSARGISVNSDGVNVNTGNGLTIDSKNCVIVDPATVLPKGMIMMYSPPSGVTAIPAGWALCDGTNGTPNLVDRFILAGSLSNVGGKTSTAMSGSNIASKSFSAVSDKGNLNVSAGLDETTLTIDQIPSHAHEITDGIHRLYSSGSFMSQGQYGNQPPTISGGSKFVASAIGGGKGHTHGIHINNQEHTHATPITPPYYILAFIMKT